MPASGALVRLIMILIIAAALPCRAEEFNVPFLFHSNWREAPLVATDQQIRIGGIYPSPIVVNGVVYFGSTDGFVYALE